MNYVDAPTIHRVFDEKTMYRNFSTPRGLCLIINNEHFEQMPTRNGTKADKDNISNLFRCMGYIVHCKDNLTGRVKNRKKNIRVECVFPGNDVDYSRLCEK